MSNHVSRVNLTRVPSHPLTSLDGKNQESTSEAVHAYYAISLFGLVTNQSQVRDFGRLLLAMEIRSTRLYYHMAGNSSVYQQPFSNNGIVGVLWSDKADYATFFGGPPPAHSSQGGTGGVVLQRTSPGDPVSPDPSPSDPIQSNPIHSNFSEPSNLTLFPRPGGIYSLHSHAAFHPDQRGPS